MTQKVRDYFKARGSRARNIWARQFYSASMGGWQIADFCRWRDVRAKGPLVKQWPLDVEMVAFTDGTLLADFTRRELMDERRPA